MRPARSSTLRWCEIAGCVMSNGAHNSPTLASPRARRVRIARRVGSASASNVASSVTGSCISTILYKYQQKCRKFTETADLHVLAQRPTPGKAPAAAARARSLPPRGAHLVDEPPASAVGDLGAQHGWPG